MNDKLQLFYSYDNFKIKSNNQLDVNKIYKNDVLISENKYCNYKTPDGLNFCNLDVNDFGVKLVFNPQKILKYNFINNEFISYTQFNQSINLVEQIVNDVIGVELKIKDGKINRYDNSFDMQLSNQFSKYANILKRIKGVKSGLQRNANDFEIKNSLYFGNKSNKVVFYDKSNEINNHRDFYSYIDTVPSNVIRVEHRRLKSKSNITLNNISEQRYYTIRNQSKLVINQRFFNVNMELLNEVEFLLINSIYDGNFKQSEMNRVLANLLINNSNIDLKAIKVERNNKNYRNWLNFTNSHSKEFYIDNEVILDLFNEIRNQFNRVA